METLAIIVLLAIACIPLIPTGIVLFSGLGKHHAKDKL